MLMMQQLLNRCNKIIIQSTCEVIVILMNGGFTTSSAALLIEDICNSVYMLPLFLELSFFFLEESNSVAHSLLLTW
jgi:hypothetical protein